MCAALRVGIACAVAAAAACSSTRFMSNDPITRAPFGTHDGQQVELYTLRNANGLALKVTTYGATVTELHVPDASGAFADVVLGFTRSRET